MLATSEAPFAPFSPPISSLGITLSTDRMDSLPTRWIGTLGTVRQRLLESMLWRACFCLEVLCFPRGILFAPHPPRPRLAILEHSCFLTTESGSRKRERSCDNTTAPLAASHYTHASNHRFEPEYDYFPCNCSALLKHSHRPPKVQNIIIFATAHAPTSYRDDARPLSAHSLMLIKHGTAVLSKERKRASFWL